MIVTTENETNQEELNLKPLLARSVVNSLGAGMVSPFTGAYAVQLGASSTDMAWFQSSANLSNNLMQIVWGRLSDRLKRRIPFIFLGTFIVATLWIPMMMVANATQLIVLLAFQALLGSMATPAWTALIGDLVPSSKLGRVNALINKWASIGGLIATLASGILMVMATGGSVQGIFFIPLVTAATLGIAASLVTLYIKEPKKALQETKERGASSILSIFGLAAKTTPFARYCTVAAIFEFFMSFSWPLFSITQIKILHADMLQIALLSVVQTIVTIAFQNWAGKIADTKGRKPLLIFFRLSLITVPVAYALSPNMET
ncbi:MAG: MFS transporter, partial [Candidatus Bathyarchaeia archaeon]